ncbi:Kinesin motor domain [Dillenia turbinata]|uniref:Kinesin motor domain n=1 Tax=Dillenia turbinata TaxID=194707 RepID=A0AAN8UJ66_9MAGN
MFITGEQEESPLSADNGILKSPLGSDPDFININGLLPESPPIPVESTDMSVVPEHEKIELEQTISILEGEIAGLKLKHRSLDEKRREALNKILDTKGSIRVFCRIRPPILANRRSIRLPISAESEKIVVRSAGSAKEFGFDCVFPQETSQENVFVEVEPILRSALDGHNVCILAYGQTGTGKTFTMDGTNDQLGIIPRALKELFNQAFLDNACSYTCSMSMLEVYMGNLRDLLAPKPSHRAREAVTRCNLNIQTDPKGLVEIEGLTEVQIPDLAKANWWYAKGRGFYVSSLTRINIFRHGDASEAKPELSKLWMVDLGGSERLLKTGATGQTLDEGRAINLSLSALGDVIAALRRKRGHVPYRNSKLTQILKDSLGDGSKVLMLVHISTSGGDVRETICSLSFAKRARAIETYRELGEGLRKQRQERIDELVEEMRETEQECQKIRNQLKKAEFLLHENKILFSTFYQPHEDEGMTPKSPKEDPKEVPGTPQKSEKPIRKKVLSSVPRFMNSTVASRQRQTASEREIDKRVRSSRWATKSSVQFFASHSLSYSDPHFKAIIRNPNKKTRYGEVNAAPAESPKCNGVDLTTVSVIRIKSVTSSDPNLRAKLGRHRRRIKSDRVECCALRGCVLIRLDWSPNHAWNIACRGPEWSAEKVDKGANMISHWLAQWECISGKTLILEN